MPYTEEGPGARDLRMDRAYLMEEQGMEIANQGALCEQLEELSRG